MPKKSSGLYVHMLLSQPTTMLIPEVLLLMLPLLYQCRFIQCFLIFFKKMIFQIIYMNLFINMQQIQCFNPLPLAQRSAVLFQQRSGRNFLYIPVNAIPTLSQSKKHIFPLTFALHGTLILTGTYRRSLCLDLMLLTSKTGNAAPLLPRKPPHLPTRNLHMEITVFFLFNFLFLDT